MVNSETGKLQRAEGFGEAERGLPMCNIGDKGDGCGRMLGKPQTRGALGREDSGWVGWGGGGGVGRRWGIHAGTDRSCQSLGQLG